MCWLLLVECWRMGTNKVEHIVAKTHYRHFVMGFNSKQLMMAHVIFIMDTNRICIIFQQGGIGLMLDLEIVPFYIRKQFCIATKP